MRPSVVGSLGCLIGILLTACGGSSSSPTSMPVTPTPAPTPPPSVYFASNLVSDGSVPGTKTDANLINPWGIVFATGAPVWIANNGTQTSTLYDGTGTKAALVVVLPAGVNGAADPTGIVANSTVSFVLTNGVQSAPARFIFDGEGGTIIGWAPTVNATNGVIVYDDGAGGAVYKGLAVGNDGTNNFLFATDFHNSKVDVFDATFHKVTVSGHFTDSTLPAGYAPFGIQAITVAGTTSIYVTYAMTQSGSDDEVAGAGLGVVNVFDTHGVMKARLVGPGGKLNAAWGVALAPYNFGTLSNTILVGNFGDGVINAYNAATGAFVASISDAAGTPIANPGLWGIAFGNGARNQPTNTLYFAAGIADEADGLYGRIDLGATAPDIVAPAVSITAPAAAATVSGKTMVSANAADDKGLARVVFLAGTSLIGTATAAPYSITWDTTTIANGTMNLTAVATDTGGNTTTSAPVSVTVHN